VRKTRLRLGPPTHSFLSNKLTSAFGASLPVRRIYRSSNASQAFGIGQMRSNSSKCLFLKWFFRCSAPKVQHIRMISTPFCAYGKGRFLGIFSVTIALKTFSPSGKNMFFSLPQRPLQATYGKSIILRLQRTFF
jgi:hypothetical protein